MAEYTPPEAVPTATLQTLHDFRQRVLRGEVITMDEHKAALEGFRKHRAALEPMSKKSGTRARKQKVQMSDDDLMGIFEAASK